MSNDAKVVRCAVYTRKSTEENLALEFNSLDAQREAAEAYIASQKHAGWFCLEQHYDDGGFSGGTVERPAFQRLMADIEAGKIDCIMVYKIDRLSRSLMDFARIMETLERKNVSLVSVTQQFNTTTSMGRLTLNILLSFAQFEREIISERTRDKIAAARRKGKWTGGPPILGYDREKDARGSRLLINEDEAKQVRAVFRMYLEAGSMLPALQVMKKRGWKTKRFQTTEGHWRGGRDFDKSALQKMLTNITYLGKVSYKGEIFDGEHAAIVDEELFGQVQGLLRRNRNSGGRYVRNKCGALLKGMVRCKHCGCAMSHHFATRGDRRYRYYVCGCIGIYGTAKTDHGLLAEHIARSERWVEVTGPYGTVREWSILPTKPDNHWLDCLVGCAAAASMCGIKTAGESVPVKQRKKYTQEDLRR